MKLNSPPQDLSVNLPYDSLTRGNEPFCSVPVRNTSYEVSFINPEMLHRPGWTPKGPVHFDDMVDLDPTIRESPTTLFDQDDYHVRGIVYGCTHYMEDPYAWMDDEFPYLPLYTTAEAPCFQFNWTTFKQQEAWKRKRLQKEQDEPYVCYGMHYAN